MDNNTEVSFCEYLGFGEPREQKIIYSEAIKRYNCKLKALEKYPLMQATSFLGIKDLNGKWIITNEAKEGD